MAVQFNLLPDVKLEFNRQKHAKKTVYSLATLAVAIVVGLFILSFFIVNILQKKLLNDANSDIKKYSDQLKSIPNLDKVLTIQNQLESLPDMHSKKHVASRLFTYIPQVTPVKVKIGKLTLDTALNSIVITGTADTVKSVNQYVDTLKFTSFTTAADANNKKPAFSNVILTSVDRNEKEATYTITANFDPALFDASQTVTLIVPTEVTTRSVINAPGTDNQLFNGDTGEDNTNQGGGQ